VILCPFSGVGTVRIVHRSVSFCIFGGGSKVKILKKKLKIKNVCQIMGKKGTDELM
jgi:hypothetical protein